MQPALADFNKALDIDYNLADTYLDKGIVLMELEDYTQAWHEFDKAIWHDKNLAEAYRLRAEAATYADKKTDVMKDYRKAAQLGDEDANFLLRQNHWQIS